VPTLLLHGEFDALADPDQARSAASHLSHSKLIILPLSGHGAAPGCPYGLSRRFLDNPTGPLDTTCVARMRDNFQWVINADAARKLAGALSLFALLPGLATAVYGGAIVIGLARRRAISWRMTFQRIGWWPLPATLAATVALAWFGQFIDWKPGVVDALAVAASLVMGVQTALALAPSDEPMLEVMLAAPQPYARLKLGQIAALFVAQAALALAVIGVSGAVAGANVAAATLGWIAPALFMCGLAAVITARSQQSSVGALVTIMAALGLALGAENLLPAAPMGKPWPVPLSLIQPYVWLINPFLRADALTFDDYLANRVIVSALGVGMIALALWELSRTERVLMASLEK
jgi:hypothetical protein